jgi:hypothetical protein
VVSGPDYGLRNKPFLARRQVTDFMFEVIEILSYLRARDHR